MSTRSLLIGAIDGHHLIAFNLWWWLHPVLTSLLRMYVLGRCFFSNKNHQQLHESLVSRSAGRSWLQSYIMVIFDGWLMVVIGFNDCDRKG